MTTTGKYEFWLCDDAGRKLQLLDDYSFFSYSRTVNGYGTIEIGMPHRTIVRPRVFFSPDWRIDVWRCPAPGYPMRRECSFFLRKYTVYKRSSDGMLMTIYYGRSPIDLLRRFGGYSQNTAGADGSLGGDKETSFKLRTFGINTDISGAMYYIACQNMSGATSAIFPSPSTAYLFPSDYMAEEPFPYSAGVFTVYEPAYNFFGKTALETIRDLQNISFILNQQNPANEKVYFDIVEGNFNVTFGFYYRDVLCTQNAISAPDGFGYVFRTYVGLRGSDRRATGVVFSVENGNLIDPILNEDWNDEWNDIRCNNSSSLPLSASANSPGHVLSSRWNHSVLFQSISTDNITDSRGVAKSTLRKNITKKQISCEFLDSPGGVGQPRCLYGVDWDLGDMVKVSFVGVTLDAEIRIVYVSMDENGKESVTGRNEIGE